MIDYITFHLLDKRQHLSVHHAYCSLVQTMQIDRSTSQEVTCLKCFRHVHINPDRVRCEGCDANLRALLSPDVARAYFYGRSRQFFDRGEIKSALAEANRGLSQYEDAEMRLLAAILARQMGELDQMRKHVAAIPIDDRLRKEAEWLLRSQYSPERRRQRIESLATPTEQPEPDITRSHHVLRMTVGVLLSIALLVLAWNLWRQNPQITLNLPVTPIPNATVIPNATPTLSPEPIATGEVKEGIVDQGDASLAALNSQTLLERSEEYDLKLMLQLAGKSDLTALPIQARKRGTVLLLNGTVQMVAQRNELIEFARTISGIEDVDAIALQVRTPGTYTVQSGDTLWLIGFKFYGDDAQRIAQIFEANRAVMNNANDLRVGMVLTLPQFE